MTLFKEFGGLVVVALLIAGIASAQNPPGPNGSLQSVQQIPTKADAATVAGSSAGSAATITIAAVGNMYFYLTGIDITNCAGASAVTAAAVTSLTTTNIAGSPAWTIGSGTTAGSCQPTIALSWPTALKSAVPGTATTFVLPTFATNQTIRVNVYGYYAP